MFLMVSSHTKVPTSATFLALAAMSALIEVMAASISPR
jgi:hypothetical protein